VIAVLRYQFERVMGAQPALTDESVLRSRAVARRGAGRAPAHGFGSCPLGVFAGQVDSEPALRAVLAALFDPLAGRHRRPAPAGHRRRPAPSPPTDDGRHRQGWCCSARCRAARCCPTCAGASGHSPTRLTTRWPSSAYSPPPDEAPARLPRRLVRTLARQLVAGRTARSARAAGSARRRTPGCSGRAARWGAGPDKPSAARAMLPAEADPGDAGLAQHRHG